MKDCSARSASFSWVVFSSLVTRGMVESKPNTSAILELEGFPRASLGCQRQPRATHLFGRGFPSERNNRWAHLMPASLDGSQTESSVLSLPTDKGLRTSRFFHQDKMDRIGIQPVSYTRFLSIVRDIVFARYFRQPSK